MFTDNRSFNQIYYGRWWTFTNRYHWLVVYLFLKTLNWRLFYDEVTISSQCLFMFDQMKYAIDLFIDQPFCVLKKVIEIK